MSRAILSQSYKNTKPFDATINVAGVVVAPNALAGGGLPDAPVVTLTTHGEQLVLTPAEAFALAAALQAVALHQLESFESEAR